MALYDLYTAKVYYSNPEEGHEWKPVVQIKENASDPDSFAVLTHHDPRARYTGEIEVKDFKECGLKQKSTIRLTQRIDKPRKRRKIGTLTPELAAKVTTELFKPHKIEHHQTEDIDDDFTIGSILNEVLND